MSEPPSRGAERDLFRDTWVRYLGERRARACDDPTTTTTCLGKQGSPDAGQGESGTILVVIWPGPETGLREG